MSTARDVSGGAPARARRRLLCGAWLLVTLAAAAIILWRFSGASPLQTNLLALLPATEANPVAETRGRSARRCARQPHRVPRQRP